MKVKEESEKADLELNIQKTKIMASNSVSSWQTDGETVGTVIVNRVTEQQVLDISPSCKCLSNPHLPKRWKSLYFKHIKNSSREGTQCLLFLCSEFRTFANCRCSISLVYRTSFVLNPFPTCHKYLKKYSHYIINISIYIMFPEKEMATHSGIHIWKIPWMEEPAGLWSMGLQRGWTWLSD